MLRHLKLHIDQHLLSGYYHILPPSPLVQFIKVFLNQTNHAKWNGAASEDILTWIYAVTVSMFAFGAALGSMLAGYFSDEKGR